MSRAGVAVGLLALATACSGEPVESTGDDPKQSSGSGGKSSGAGGDAGQGGQPDDGDAGESGSGDGGSHSNGGSKSSGGSNQGGDSAGGAGGGPAPECEAGDERAGKTVCGINGRGHVFEECVEGAFQESTRCDDPDECVDEEEKWGDVCTGGTDLLTCTSGSWVAECVDAWVVTLGTSSNDIVRGFDLDADGNSYVVGLTTGDLDGANAGYDDAFLVKLDNEGDPVWTKQWGTTTPDVALDVARVADGSIFVIGYTNSDLSGQESAGSADAYLRKMDSLGTELWTKQWGTLAIDGGLGVFSHGDCVYGVGRTEGALGGSSSGGTDAWARRSDPADGTTVWTAQWGSDSYDEASRGTTDSDGDVIVVGYTEGALGAETNRGLQDAFVRKLASDTGGELWTTQFGTAASDTAVDVVTDAADDLIVIGSTAGVFPVCESAGGVDAFLVKLDATSGDVELEVQWGTAGDDVPWAITRDAAGNFYVAGSTSGTLKGASAGLKDAFLTKLDAAGVVLWSEQWGSAGDEVGCGLGLDAAQGIYVAGFTGGALSGPNFGENDAFLQHFQPH